MAVTAAPSDEWSNAPSDFDEFFDRYYEWVVHLVRKLGVEGQDVEDVASEIMVRFFEVDLLHRFDGTLVFQTKQGPVPARFKSFVSANVEVYVRGKKERREARSKREPVICDMPVKESSGGTSRTWMEVFGNTEVWDDVSRPECAQLCIEVAHHLKAMPVHGKRDLAKMWELIRCQLAEGHDRPDRRAIATELGLSLTAVSTMVGELRTAIRFVMYKRETA